MSDSQREGPGFDWIYEDIISKVQGLARLVSGWWTRAHWCTTKGISTKDWDRLYCTYGTICWAAWVWVCPDIQIWTLYKKPWSSSISPQSHTSEQRRWPIHRSVWVGWAPGAGPAALSWLFHRCASGSACLKLHSLENNEHDMNSKHLNLRHTLM